MFLSTVYTVIDDRQRLRDRVALPLEVQLDDGASGVLEEHGDGLRVVIRRPVDHRRLEVVKDSGWFREGPSGERIPLPRLRLVDDQGPEPVMVDDFISAVTFLTDAPLSLSKPMQDDRFVAENEEDRALLDRLGTSA